MTDIQPKILCLLICFSLFFHCGNKAVEDPQSNQVMVGASDTSRYLPLLKGKRIGLFANQSSVIPNKVHSDTSRTRDLIRTLDIFMEERIQVVKLFAPEHGVFGKAPDGKAVSDIVEPVYKIPVVSLYGKKKKPSTEDLSGIDLIVFDIQDVGVRAYTYISSLHYMMEACAELDIPMIVMDRPNPNAHIIDGPLLDTAFRSFVGMHEIPFAYGMTIGELALMVNGEGWLEQGIHCDLTVIPCRNYTHHTPYDLPVDPSPNLPDMRSVLLYPSLCFFEGTTFSIGRGTDYPFQVIGHPALDSNIYPFTFVPHSLPAAPNPKHKNEICHGIDLRTSSVEELRSTSTLKISWLITMYKALPEENEYFRKDGYFNKLAGNNKFMHQLRSGLEESLIRASWADELRSFKSLRNKYLLYPE